MNDSIFAIKGNILHSTAQAGLESRENSWLLCKDGQVAEIYEKLPQEYAGVRQMDYGSSLVIPGLVDLHLHAPQYAFRALGMDLELLEWLNTHTFPEESKYSDVEYAQKSYQYFVQALHSGATTRAVVFATVHLPATALLMDMLEESGLVSYVGKVNMDRNSPDGLREESAAASVQATREWLAACKGKYERVRPILTPRFVPSCTDELLEGLAALQKETGLPVQSHLSENPGEVEWVRQLCPQAENYADAYKRLGLFGSPVEENAKKGEKCPTIMAHCVHSSGKEADMLAENGVFVAHCPISNSCLSSGVAPVREFLDKGVQVGLGSDIAGGYALSLFEVMRDAVKDSKLRWRLRDESLAPLSALEAFYLGTRGGGAFFGKVGAFEPGWEFDALVIDDSGLPCPFALTAEQRLERVIYLGSGDVQHKYVRGRQLF